MDLVIRSPERVRTEEGRTVDVVDEHNALIAKKGRVALAKFGAPTSERTLGIINEAIRNKSAPYLYLISKSKNTHYASKSHIIATYVRLPIDLRSFVPDYYELVEYNPSTWFILDRPFQPASIDKLVLVSSGRSLLDVLRETRTASMLVKRK
jgi:hypothetical protein